MSTLPARRARRASPSPRKETALRRSLTPQVWRRSQTPCPSTGYRAIEPGLRALDFQLCVLRARLRRAEAQRVPLSVFQLPDRIQSKPGLRGGRADGPGVSGPHRSQPCSTGPEDHQDDPRIPASPDLSPRIKRSAEWEVAVERPTYDLTIFKLHCGKLTLKIYTKGERVLRIEVVAHNTRELNCGRSLDKFPEVVSRLKSVLERFADALSCIDQCFIADEMLEQLPAASRVAKTIVGGIDLNKARMRRVIEALLALSSSPNGFTASEVAARVRALSKQSPSQYGPRHAAYDLKKLRGKHIIRRIGHTRRYEPLLTGLRAMTALLVLRDKAIKPLLAAAQPLRPKRGAHNPKPIDLHYDPIQTAMQGVFHELGLAA